MQINKSLTHFHNYGNRSDLLSIVCMFFGFRFFLLFHLYICIVDFLLSYCTLEENNDQCSHGSIHMLSTHFAYDYKFVETIRNRIGAQTHTHTTVEMVHACNKGHGWKQTQHTIFYNCMKAARSYKFSINKNVLKEFYWQEIDINTLHRIFSTFLLIRCYNSWLKS